MDAVKLQKLQSMSDQVRIGGKGTARRKKKVVHKSAVTDEKKLQSSLKKLGVNTIPTIEEVNMFKDDGTVIHFKNPKVEASLQANTFTVTGHSDVKSLTEMLPTVWNQMGPVNVQNLKNFAEQLQSTMKKSEDNKASEDDEDDVPELVSNFDEQCKTE